MTHRSSWYGPGGAVYQSEFTRFIDGYLHDHPDVARDQQLGWRIWWERPVKLDELEKAQHDSVPLPPYYYST